MPVSMIERRYAEALEVDAAEAVVPTTRGTRFRPMGSAAVPAEEVDLTPTTVARSAAARSGTDLSAGSTGMPQVDALVRSCGGSWS